MRKCTDPYLLAVMLAAMLLVPAAALAQPPDRATVLKVARDVMTQARYCDMVTIGEDGQPQARVIDAFAPDAGFTVWIATNPLSRKVAQIRKDARVTLLYFSPNAMAYVTLMGRAALVSDPSEKAKRWKEDWATLYKDKNRGDDYLLVKITATRLEVSAEGLGVRNDKTTWKPVVIDLK
jgi:general stress protein 26